jgi:hypothetical protein
LEEEDMQKQNADVLEAIGKAIHATKVRAEEKRRKELEEEQLRRHKLEQERRKVVVNFKDEELTG